MRRDSLGGCVATLCVLAACGDPAGPAPAVAALECKQDETCDDGLACTEDRCDERQVCVNTPIGRGCPVEGACVDCAALDDPAGCLVGLCDPEVGCRAEPVAAGTPCGEPRCVDGVHTPAGACAEGGVCVAAAPEPCGGEITACEARHCSADGARCLALPALTAACQLPGGEAPEIWRGAELRRMAGVDEDAWRFERREVIFQDGKMALTTRVDETGASKTQLDPPLYEGDPGAFELDFLGSDWLATMTPDARVLVGVPVRHSGLQVLLRAPAEPLAPDALAGRWAVLLTWTLPAWHPGVLFGHVGEVGTWVGEIDLSPSPEGACSGLDDRVASWTDDAYLLTAGPHCLATSETGAFAGPLRFRFSGSPGFASLHLEGTLGAGGDLAVATVASEPDGGERSDVHGLVLLVRVAAPEGALVGRYATLALHDAIHSAAAIAGAHGPRSHFRGQLTFDAHGDVASGALDRLPDTYACLPDGPTRERFRVRPAFDTGLPGTLDVPLVDAAASPPFAGTDFTRLTYAGSALPGLAALDGASPLWVGTRVNGLNLHTGALDAALRGPALLVWRPPGAEPHLAPIGEDPDSWCLP